jgi:hypothetical protein
MEAGLAQGEREREMQILSICRVFYAEPPGGFAAILE